MTTTTTRHARRIDPTPAGNAGKIRQLLQAGEGCATLYRAAHAGPAGQRTNIPVGIVRYLAFGPEEFRIIDPRTGDHIGYAGRTLADGEWWWSITIERYDGGLEWLGYAETLSLGCDVAMNGTHTATRRHDSARVSVARWRSADSVHAARAREHVAGCEPCRTAGETGGFFACVAR